MWLDTGREGDYMYGPHYAGDVKEIKKRLYHSMDDLLLINISVALKKRIKGAKIGTIIKLHKLHSNGNLAIKCIDSIQLAELKKIEQINSEVEYLQHKINALTKKEEMCKLKIFGLEI